MSLSLVDELTQKQAPKFQVNRAGRKVYLESIYKTISENNEGILNLSSDIDKVFAQGITNAVRAGNRDYSFELNHTPTNYEIMFKKKEAQN